MLTVSELFRETCWDKVKDELVELYPETEENLAAFEEVYNKIFSIISSSNSDTTYLVSIKTVTEEDGTVWEDVFGYFVEKGVVDWNNTYGLDLSLITEWADFLVDPNLLLSYQPEEIVAHILWEATFYGFSDEEILNFRKKLEYGIEELKKNPEKGILWEKVLEELEQDEERVEPPSIG